MASWKLTSSLTCDYFKMKYVSLLHGLTGDIFLLYQYFSTLPIEGLTASTVLPPPLRQRRLQSRTASPLLRESPPTRSPSPPPATPNQFCCTGTVLLHRSSFFARVKFCCTGQILLHRSSFDFNVMWAKLFLSAVATPEQ